MPKTPRFIIYFQAIALFCCFVPIARANDGAVERTPSGLVFKKIDSVSIDKEVLVISRNKVEVSYEFRNNADKDVDTDVAFPIPNYNYVEMNVTADPAFDDFMVQVNGKQIKYEVAAKALLKGKDYTKLLTDKGITVHDYNATNTEKPLNSKSYGDRLITSILKQIGPDKDKYVNLGLISEDGFPNWKVSKTYVWRQRFPKNSTVNIKHSYTPCYGVDQFYSNPGYKEALPTYLKQSCLDQKNSAMIMHGYTEKNRLLRETVTYILKTANTWQQPIKEFTVLIEKNSDEFLGVCFDGKINAHSLLLYRATIKDYRPSKDLKVHWIKKVTDK